MCYGRNLSKGYCLFEANSKYGWYADPSLVVSIKGFIKKDKIHKGTKKELKKYKNLKITKVELGTPLPTGLE